MAADAVGAPGLHRGSVTPVGNAGHEHWMQECLDRAKRGAGFVSPNPMVGAILVAPDGSIVGEGWHEQYGGPHAEVQALRSAEERHGPEVLRNATLYVNLEPCNHHGKTPPCTSLIIEKGVPQVVIGTIDPFPRAQGEGIRELRDHGIDVEVGISEHACLRLNEAFFHHVETGRPLVTVKVAQTLDGRVATCTGDSKWVTGEAARTLVHRWRAEMDGVLVGSGTARSDDPRLTVRHTEGPQPLRLVLDRDGTLPSDRSLFTDDYVNATIAVVGSTQQQPEYADALTEAGGAVLRIDETPERHLDLDALFQRLGAHGDRNDEPIQSVLVEAGPGLATALFKQDLVDRFFCFLAPKVVGSGVPSVRDLGILEMEDSITFAEKKWETVGEDVLFRGYRRAV